MAATTIKQATFADFEPVREQTDAVAADRIAQNSILTELPGAAFAFLTLAYLVVSIAGL